MMSWISVEESLPEYGENVLWLFNNGYMSYDCLDKWGYDHILEGFSLAEGGVIFKAKYWSKIELPIGYFRDR